MWVKQFLMYHNADQGGGAGAGAQEAASLAEQKPEDNENNAQDEKERLFTQEDVERIVKERLARERKKAQEREEQARREAEKKALEEQQRYKELYETLMKELQEEKLRALEAKKEALLAQAGYTAEQISRYKKYLSGETDDELKASLDELMADIPPKPSTTYVDPKLNTNGAKKQDEQSDLNELGRSLFKKLKQNGLIR